MTTEVPKGRFRVLSMEEFQDRSPPAWLIGETLPMGGQAMLFGPPGEGKSFVALDQALCVATGIPWHGRRVKQGAVLYVAAEGAAGLTIRTEAWKRHHGIDEIPNAYFVVDAPQLHVPGDVDDLLRAIDAVPNMQKPVLIITDTFARCFVGGAENESQDVGRWIAGAGKIQQHTGGATFMALHHTKKQQRKGEVQERGSSSFRGAADTMIAVRKKGKDVILTCEKQKDAEEFAPLSFQMQEVRWPSLDGERSSCVLVGGEAPVMVGFPPARQIKLLRLLADLGEVATTAESLKRWEVAGEKERTFHDDRTALIDQGYVARMDRGSYAVTDAGKRLLQLH